MRRRITPKGLLGGLGLIHLLALYGYGLLHYPVLTIALALCWIIIVLHFWREEKP